MRHALSAVLFPGLLACATGAAADVPRVLADIAPVQSLVARVMQGVGTPDLLIPPGVSAHDMALRPSQARALSRADLVVWVGPEMSPWLGRALEAIEGRDMVLLRVPGTQLYDMRDEALFAGLAEDHAGHVEGHDDQHDHGADDDHDAHGVDDGHDDHGADDDHDAGDSHDAHGADDGHDDHGADDGRDAHAHGGHDHAHDGTDPHAWLDPLNAATWMGALAETLATLDPDHAALYRENAAQGAGELAALSASIEARLAPARATGLIAFHDAFQYFEARYGLTMVGSITPADDSDPGPARISALRDATRDGAVACAFSEPQFNPGLLQAVTEEAGLPVAILDPLGSDLDPGPDLYPTLLGQLADAVVACVGDDAG
ncbi:zinc ABC transporter substrate-binding protein [Marinibacterium sp. SX1]|uniref:zinc ABC transporter substrate-binding protein n=1 Tax=Marinibacterium sp. SX1 TaxID=3388424 RepID=UPI003D1850A9